MAITKEELIRNFSKAIRDGNAAIFGGAGLSRPSGFVDWKGLLRPLAKDIKLNVDKEHDLLAVAQYYRDQRHSRQGINQAIINAFSKDVATNENVKILSRLPIFTYWTTNYDTVIENGIKEANRNPDVKTESSQLSTIMPDRDAVVYKMHGDVSIPANAILTKEDYELYDIKRPLFRTALKGDLVSKVFLFIGFSFEDPNLNYILGQIHSLLGENVPTHYCFFRRIQENEYINREEDFIYDKDKQSMQEENLRNYGIQTVFVDSYEEITVILQEIERAFKMNSVFISGSASAYEDPWDRNNAEELAGKLAKRLVQNNYRISSGFGLGIGSAVINGALDIIYSEKYRHMEKHLCLHPFPQNISDPVERAERWKKYRENILEGTGVCIFLFGNKEDVKTKKIIIADGCIQEFKIAKEKRNIIIPIGSTGFAAEKILEEIKNDISSYPYLSAYLDRLEKENNVEQIVELVMEILNNLI